MKGIEKARKAVGHVSCPQDREDEMYRLGMLAAADIAKDCYSRDEAHSIEWAIREEAGK